MSDDVPQENMSEHPEAIEAAGVHSMANLEQWWGSLEEYLRDRHMFLIPVRSSPSKGGVDWPVNRSLSDYFRVAEDVGARIVYSLETYLDEDILNRLNDDKISTKIGRLMQIELWWIFNSVRHHCIVLADWYVPTLLAAIDEKEARERGEREAHASVQADFPSMALRLASLPQFGAARGGAAGRQRIARAEFPDLPDTFVYRLEREAWAIYGSQVLPERERDIALRAAKMLATGVTLTTVARRIGVSRDRLARILAEHGSRAENGNQKTTLPETEGHRLF